MNKTTIFLLLFVVSINAQSKATLYYKNGDSIQGYIDRIIYDYIKFSKTKKGKFKTVKPDGLDRLILYTEDGIQERHYVEHKKRKNSKKSKTRLVTLVSEGKVNYYIEHYNVGGGFGSGISFEKGFDQASLYVKRKDEKYVTLLSTSGEVLFSKNFKKSASEYFKDCPELVSKIQSGYYKKSNITEVVEFYNKKCD